MSHLSHAHRSCQTPAGRSPGADGKCHPAPGPCGVDVMDAIYHRRAVRSYTDVHVPKDIIHQLLRAAVQAPSAVNQQPWGFVVVQDRALLKKYSDAAKTAFLSHEESSDPHMVELGRTLGNPDFNIFYDAGTLIVICAGPGTLSPAEDCCLAGENLMLAACALGLGTCPIGLARPTLNLPQTKSELGIPGEFSPVLPIIVGYPAGTTPAVPRGEPRIFSWKECGASRASARGDLDSGGPQS